MQKTILPLIAALTLLLSSCASDDGRTGLGQAVGTIIGAAAGAFVGSQIGNGSGQAVAVAVGSVMGGFLGRELGRHLDEEDRRRIAEAESEAYEAPIGETVHWRNPDSGTKGNVTPTSEVVDHETETLCRTLVHNVQTKSESRQDQRMVCRQQDGSWRLI